MTRWVESLLQHAAATASGFVREDEGATMVEYGLMVSLIAIAAFAAVVHFGTSLQSLYGHIRDEIAAATH